MAGLTYKDAGVDIDAGDTLVDTFRALGKATHTAETLSGIGGFASLCALPKGLEEPILVSGTDGVGTKLKVAFLTGNHSTIGIDLVAMCVNDVITCGAKPLFFLDYFGTGRLQPEIAKSVVSGIAKGCELAGCALLGGETAEMPDFYPDGEYDLAGFCVGVVDKKRIIDGKAVRPGDVLLGIGSSGLHSNGYSLARAVLLDRNKINLETDVGGRTLESWLLEPTKIYARLLSALRQKVSVHAAAHITGGGIGGNLPRVLPENVVAHIQGGSWEVPAIFDLIAKKGPVDTSEMQRVFNMGLGMIIAVPKDSAETALEAIALAGEAGFVIGEVREGKGEAEVKWS